MKRTRDDPLTFSFPVYEEVLSNAKRRGEGLRNPRKSTHNSVVEASLYAKECFDPENRDEYRAQAATFPIDGGRFKKNSAQLCCRSSRSERKLVGGDGLEPPTLSV